MAFDPLNPVVDILGDYGLSYAQNRLLGSAYTYNQALTKYPCALKFYAWCGYTQAEVLLMDELSTAFCDGGWKTATVMSNMPWGSNIPDSVFDNGAVGKGVITLPQGRFDLTMPLLMQNSGQLLCVGKRPFFERNNAYQTTSTVVTPNYAGWVGAPATPSAAFLARTTTAIFNRIDCVRTLNFGGNYGGGYCEGLKIKNLFISGNRNPSGSWWDPSFVSTGIAVYDMGETSEITNCYIEEMNDFGIESVFGTPGTYYNNSTFRCGRYGLMITGGGSGHSVHRIYGQSGDDNGMALIGIQDGYGYTAGGNIEIYGVKHEALGRTGQPNNYTALTSQGIPGKGQLLFNNDSATQILNLNIFGGGTKNLECAIDSLIRVGTPVAGIRTTVNVQGLYVYGMNAVKNLLQVGGRRYPVPANASFMAHSFVFTSDLGATTGNFQNLNGFTITPSVSNCTSRLGWLPWNPGTGAVTGSWDYTTCDPSWSPETGIGGIIPPPPPATPVPTTIGTLTLTPSSVPAGTSSQANAPTVYDQFGNPIAATGTWGITGTGVSINGAGVITTTVQGNATVTYTVTGIATPATAILQVTAVAPPPPPPGALYSIVFAGKNVMALPGCVPVPANEAWRAGVISGANFNTYSAAGGNRATNTAQRFSTPIAGVRRIVLTGCVIKQNQPWLYLNDRARTSGNSSLFVTGGSPSTPIATYTTNAAAATITIQFATPQTITHLVGSADYYTLDFTCTSIELWAT